MWLPMPLPRVALCCQISRSPAGSATAGGLRRSASTNVKIVVLAPMPTASDSTATAVSPRLATRRRNAYRRSWPRVSMKIRYGRRSDLFGIAGSHTMRPIMRTAAALLAVSLATLAAQAPEPLRADLTLRADQPKATINRNIYGHFAEHLGRLIYEGLWVGEKSPIPNTGGIRNDVVAALKELNIPVLRWPGGCFADEYHWRDGIGPRDKRPRRPNASWGGVDTNAFGTHEFMDLCEMLGAEPYINGNLGSGSPQEMMEWIEYMTSDSDSTLARLRRQNGRDKPWKVPYFAVGNESWGCGGEMRPEQ